MANYKKFLIQQQTYNGSQYTNVGNVVDTQEMFRVACQDFPFKKLPEIKELPKHDWYDENGDDVYIPIDGYKFKAYDVEATFLYFGTEQTMQNDISNFIEFIYGRIDSSGSRISSGIVLAVYDEYTQIGRRGVVVTEVNNTLYFDVDFDPDAIAQFKIKFRITDPNTDITLTV